MQTEFAGIKKPRQETADKYWKVKAMVKDEGKTLVEACRAVSMARPTYQDFKKRFDPEPLHLSGSNGHKKRGPKPGSKNAKTYIDIPMHAAESIADEKMVVVVCKASQLKNILDGLK